MASLSKAGAALAALREDLTGEVFAPGDAGYDEARTVFNAMIDRRPAVIAQCADEADVVAAVRFAAGPGPARRGARRRAQRGGQGLSDGGVVVDLRRMHGVDGRSRRPVAVRVGGRGHDEPSGPGLPRRTAWRPPAAGSPPPGSAGSSSAAAPAGWTAPRARRRQPPRRGAGDRRRRAGARDRRGAPGAVLGPARRRRQLRRRHLAHPAAARAARVLASRCCCTSPEHGPEVVRTYRRRHRRRTRTRRAAACSTSPARPRSSYRRSWSARSLCGALRDVRRARGGPARAGRAAAGAAARGGDRRRRCRTPTSSA